MATASKTLKVGSRTVVVELTLAITGSRCSYPGCNTLIQKGEEAWIAADFSVKVHNFHFAAKPAAAAAASAPAVRTNKYSAECEQCHITVAPGEGRLEHDGDQWVVTHRGICPRLSDDPED